jgi:16S rRNA (cytosine967-C5)-methyltransferase
MTNRRHYERVAFQKPREIAVQTLLHRESSRDYVETLLAAELAKATLSPQDRALAQELVYGVVRWQAALDWLIHRQTDGRVQKRPLRILLRLGLYQILWLDRIPDHAAVHETVELARQFGCGPQSGFVNALLRNYTRKKLDARAWLADLKRTDPATGWSHPAWLFDRWKQRWGGEDTVRLLEWNNAPPPTHARVNTLRTDPAALKSAWETEGVQIRPCASDWAGAETVFELADHPPLAGLASFQEGRFYVQDPSTLLAVHLLDPQPGEAILDLCAAPGGKTTFIAQRMKNQGRILAVDNDPDRLKLLAENCGRLGVDCVEAHPEEVFQPEPAGFDRILIDAPCSNTGVLRRRVDLRWRVRAEELERLARAQTALLDRAAAWLKPMGTLVYSTCSLEPEENQNVVQAFLAAHAQFKLEGERELVPFRDGVDGAYVARLTKVGDLLA